MIGLLLKEGWSHTDDGKDILFGGKNKRKAEHYRLGRWKYFLIYISEEIIPIKISSRKSGKPRTKWHIYNF